MADTCPEALFRSMVLHSSFSTKQWLLSQEFRSFGTYERSVHCGNVCSSGAVFFIEGLAAT